MCKTALFAHFLRRKCGFTHFRRSFWNRRKPHSFAQISYLPISALWLVLKLITPPPNPELLTKDFCLEPDLEWIFLQRRTWLGQKLLPQEFPGLSLPHKGKTSLIPSLIFLSLLFWEKQGKPPKKARIFLSSEPPKSLGKKGKRLKKARNSLQRKK